MREAGIGRVLVASLHQGIADLMPSRLEFYENWLNPDGLRQGTIGLAPLLAVLSFLRQEGEPYGRVMAHAGTCAADWLLSSRRRPLGPLARRLPAGLRTRGALGTTRRLVRACYGGNRAAIRGGAGARYLEIRDSVFCGVREPAAAPLCGFYEALTARVLRAYGLDCVVRASACRATGAGVCRLSLSFAAPQDASSAIDGGKAVS
jgi:bacteriochlorophyll 4-vinyl reductase